MKHFFSIAVLLVLLSACKTAQLPAAIGIQPLTSFIVRTDVKPAESTSFLYYYSQQAFRDTFTLTRSLPGNVVMPDFNSQRVVAIILPPTTDISNVSLTRAEVIGKDLNIYYELTVQAGSTFVHTPFSVAAIPKSQGIKSVNFYKGAAKEKTIDIAD